METQQNEQGTPTTDEILSEGESEEGALVRNIASGKQVGELVATTLGPRGRDKIIYPEDEHEAGQTDYFEVTNSGAYLLKQVTFQTPAASVIARVAKAQDDRCGDGTTTTAVYAGNALDQAGKLIERGFHARSIIKGIQRAVELALEAIEDNAVSVDATDRDVLENVVQTALNGKMAESLADELCELVLQFADNPSALDDVQTESLRAGTVGDTEFLDGMVFKKSFAGNYEPTSLTDARVAVVTQPVASAQQIRQRFERDEVEDKQEIAYDVSDPAEIQALTDYEQEVMREKVKPLVEADVDVLLVGNRVDEAMVAFFDAHDIAVVRNVDTDRLERTAAAVGATVHTYIDEFSPADVGAVDSVEVRRYPEIEQNVIFLRGPAESELASVLVHGSTWSSGWEAERNIKNAISAARTVFQEGSVIPGGGAIEVAIAAHLRDEGPKVGGRESIVVESIADAIESVPKLLARSSGMDPMDTLIELRNAHHRGDSQAGVLLFEQSVGNVVDAGVLEPVDTKRYALKAAASVASTILRIDDVITNIDVEVKA